MADSKIYKQIESTAALNPPGTYSFSPTSFLTYYNDLTLAQDPLAAYFIPLSTVAQRSLNPKIFAIGVIPPSVSLTGNLLDRSSTINSILSADPTYTGTVSGISADRSTYVRELLEWACSPPQGRSENDPIYQEVVEGRDQGASQKSYSSCGDLPNWMLYSLGVRTDYVNRAENGGWKEGQNISKLAFSPVAAQITPDTQYSAGDTVVIYSEANGSDAHALVVISQQGNKLETAEYGQPGGAIRNRTVTLKDGVPYMGKRQMQKILPLKDVLADAESKGQLGDVRLPNGVLTSVKADGPTSKWDGDLADTARKQQQKLANTPLTPDEVGKAFLAAQQAQISAIKATLDAMANTPPLRMLVNPKSFSIKGDKIASDGNWGRNGPIIEHWGDNQDKISASGKVAGYYAIDIMQAGGPGLTRMARNYSQSWQNLQSLYLFYKNNGALYTQDYAAPGTGQTNLALMGSIYIYYDNILYIGSFDNFNLSEADTGPFSVEYSYDFTIRAAFLMDQPDTAQTYGRVNVPNSAAALQTSAPPQILDGANGPF